MNRTIFVRDGSDSTAFQAFAVGNVNGATSKVTASFSSNNSSWDIGALVLGAPILNEWVHYAICRQADTFYGFQNGVLGGTLKSDAPLAASTGNPAIGKYYNSSQGCFMGYIDEFRVSKGIARWIDRFDPNKQLETSNSGNTLLRVVLTDSSEREYLLKNDDANAFVSWYNRTVNTGNTCYKFTDLIDGSTEYLAFEKIISFKTLTLK